MNPSFKSPIPAHGGQLRQIAARFGVSTETLLDLSANINPAGPPASVLTAIQRALANPAALVTYPDLELTELKRTIATHVGVHPDNISVANGFVPLLDAALRSLDTVRCLLLVPSFGEYRRTLEGSKVTIIPHRLSSEESFAYNPDEILKASLGSSCDTVLLANPQNPSGVTSGLQSMLRLVEMAVERGIRVLLDEAFVDYCPEFSLILRAMEQSNLIVFRSVTKFFAIPGLRVAYAVSAPSMVQKLNRFIAPWPIASLSSDAVCAALHDSAYIEESRIINEQRRAWLQRELARLGIATYPSGTNFLLLRFPAVIDVERLWERMIVEQRIVLRSCVNFEGLRTGHLRVAVRSEQENERLIAGLKQVLKSL